jgi:DNA-binding response OmpR family regulator
MHDAIPQFRGMTPLALIIDDEIEQARAIEEALGRLDIRSLLCHTVDDGYTQAISARPDVIILDVNLQVEGDGFDLLKDLRKITLAPVIILTGRRTQEQDIQTSVEGEATTYLNKMSATPEVVAGFVRQQLQAAGKLEADQLRLGELSLDVSLQQARFRGASIGLTPMLVGLLGCLMEPPGGWKPAEGIALKLYNDDDDTAVVSVRQHVNRLRAELGKLSGAIEVKSQRGRGYCLHVEGEPLTTEGEAQA